MPDTLIASTRYVAAAPVVGTQFSPAGIPQNPPAGIPPALVTQQGVPGDVVVTQPVAPSPGAPGPMPGAPPRDVSPVTEGGGANLALLLLAAAAIYFVAK
jgi:hypothetical protein